jgi:putative tricarboxylic transport membrane protein
MKLGNTLSGLLLLLFGTVVVLHARGFPATGQGAGPGLFPLLAGAGLAGVGALLVCFDRGRRDMHRVELEEWMRRPRMVLNGVLVIGALIFYALAVDTMGFFLTAFSFLAVLFLAFGVKRRWIAPIAAVVTLGLHVTFYTFLRVPLPWGWLERIAW